VLLQWSLIPDRLPAYNHFIAQVKKEKYKAKRKEKIKRGCLELRVSLTE